jgi:hypothetical protein
LIIFRGLLNLIKPVKQKRWGGAVYHVITEISRATSIITIRQLELIIFLPLFLNYFLMEEKFAPFFKIAIAIPHQF